MGRRSKRTACVDVVICLICLNYLQSLCPMFELVVGFGRCSNLGQAGHGLLGPDGYAAQKLLGSLEEVPTVPIHHPAKPQPREQAWDDQLGKKTLLSLTRVVLSG